MVLWTLDFFHMVLLLLLWLGGRDDHQGLTLPFESLSLDIFHFIASWRNILSAGTHVSGALHGQFKSVFAFITKYHWFENYRNFRFLLIGVQILILYTIFLYDMKIVNCTKLYNNIIITSVFFDRITKIIRLLFCPLKLIKPLANFDGKFLSSPRRSLE